MITVKYLLFAKERLACNKPPKRDVCHLKLYFWQTTTSNKIHLLNISISIYASVGYAAIFLLLLLIT